MAAEECAVKFKKIPYASTQVQHLHGTFPVQCGSPVPGSSTTQAAFCSLHAEEWSTPGWDELFTY